MDLRIQAIVLAILFTGSPVGRTAGDGFPLVSQEGIDATTESVASYLAGLDQGNLTRDEVAALVEQLGSDDFSARQAAMKSLVESAGAHRDLLEKAAGDADPEKRQRARRVIAALEARAIDSPQDALKREVLGLVAVRKITGLAPALVEARAHFLDDARRWRLAFLATVGEADGALLLKLLSSEIRDLKLASAEAVLAMGKADGRRAVVALLEDAEPEVRLGAALRLLNAGERVALPALAALLRADDRSVRFRAALVLRRATAKQFGYTAASPGAEMIEVWRTWIGEHGDDCKLTLPVDVLPDRKDLVLIGGAHLGSVEFGNHFTVNGSIDEVRIYSRALEADEISLLHRAGGE